MEKQERISKENRRQLINMIGGKLPGKEMFKSFSTWTLLISNLLIAVFAILENQSALNVLWVYWFQSVIIGVFNFFKIISLKEYNVDGLKMNNKLVTKSNSAKVGIAVFFLFHYGFFHFVYAVFLLTFITMAEISSGGIDMTFILITSLVFFVNYLGEFIFNFKRDQQTVQSLPKLMMSPYKRIIPMHLTIILSGFVMAGGIFGITNINAGILLIFMFLKTFIDLLTHA